MKHIWKNPIITPSLEPGDDNITVGGTGQGSPDVYPCSYQEWLEKFAYDWDESGEIDYDDYWFWCMGYGFDPEPEQP